MIDATPEVVIPRHGIASLSPQTWVWWIRRQSRVSTGDLRLSRSHPSGPSDIRVPAPSSGCTDTPPAAT
jgi:hypothetical protein